jgi:hypothetical protein
MESETRLLTHRLLNQTSCISGLMLDGVLMMRDSEDSDYLFLL